MTVASHERSDLADLLVQLGPDQPTLCAGWSTRDLAAHLVLRERRPDAAAGIRIGPLAKHTRAVQDSLASKPWPELVELVRKPSPLLVGPLDGWINTTEMFVHLEDVRRAQPEWKPRPRVEPREQAMWRVLRQQGRLFFRRVPVGVVLALPDGTTHRVREGAGTVTVTGPATEILLYAYGRRAEALVEISGDADAVAALDRTPLRG